MSNSASELARRLAHDAEAVCRRYLSNGRREGRYWLVGEVRNTPGRSLFVRLSGPESGKGAAGKWVDARNRPNTGDLLDIIRESMSSRRFSGCGRRGAALSERCRKAPNRSPIALRRATRRRRARRDSARTLVRHVAANLETRLRRRICAIAASRLCTKPQICVFTRIATTGQRSTRRSRPGPRWSPP